MALSKKRVTTWLGTMEPNATVGYSNNPCKCPLAEFLRWDGAPSPSVGRVTYSRGPGVRRDNPEWMKAVLYKIDAGPPRRVTAAEMRTYMRMYAT